MKLTLIRQTLCMLVAVLCCTTVRPQSSSSVVVSIQVDGWGVVWPQGQHNYLTVLSDGTATYLAKAKRGLSAQIADEISEQKMDRLRSAVKTVAQLSTKDTATEKPLDYRMTLQVKADGVFLEVKHYDVDQRNVSPQLYHLLCLADDIRGETYRITNPDACKHL